jgi:hypothetical protein
MSVSLTWSKVEQIEITFSFLLVNHSRCRRARNRPRGRGMALIRRIPTNPCNLRHYLVLIQRNFCVLVIHIQPYLQSLNLVLKAEMICAFNWEILPNIAQFNLVYGLWNCVCIWLELVVLVFRDVVVHEGEVSTHLL